MAETLHFPLSFAFGVADADLQVIGEMHTQKFENSLVTMWHHFAKTKGIDSPAEGIDRYHRWKEDIEIMKQLGVKHYRTSVSMARILQKDGSGNTKAITWYQNYFKALQKAGITIYVTLYHWELPQFLHEQGGWTSRKTIDWLVKHTDAVYQNLGEYIEEYFLLNEPWTTTHLGYLYGIMAPGEKNLKHALLTAHHQLLAQGLMFKELSQHKGLKIGTVVNVNIPYANTLDEQDLLAAKRHNESFNAWFLDPLYIGKYPDYLSEYFGRSMPLIDQEDMKIIKIGDKLSVLGLNYYFGEVVRFDKSTPLEFSRVEKKGELQNGLGWPFTAPPLYPEGFYDILMQIYNSYKNFGLKRIYIAENGTAGFDSIEDTTRIAYYQEHLKQLHKALTAGIPIGKYFLWTLMDNYEWQHGYNQNAAFGIIHVDRKTLQRTLKKSAQWYKKTLKTNTISLEELEE